jgi:hypothetical protein
MAAWAAWFAGLAALLASGPVGLAGSWAAGLASAWAASAWRLATWTASAWWRLGRPSLMALGPLHAPKMASLPF